MLMTVMVLAVAAALIHIWIGGRDDVTEFEPGEPELVVVDALPAARAGDESATVVDNAINAIDRTFAQGQIHDPDGAVPGEPQRSPTGPDEAREQPRERDE